MKTKRLFRLLTTLNFLLAALPFQAVKAAPAASAAPSNLLQFTASGHALGFAVGGMYAATGTHALHVNFTGANAVQPKTESSASADGNPNSTRGEATPLGKVVYTNLWNGITLTYTADAGSIYTTTYTLAPGADPADIRLRYNAPLTLNVDGTLDIAFETGILTESAPIAWQEIPGQRVPVDASFRVSGQGVSFSLGAYDPHYALTIDPSLVWNTFLGGSGDEIGHGIAVDENGNVYVAGESGATWGTPVRAFTGGNDVFVAKLDSFGNLTWNTFLGGSGGDGGSGIAVDGTGNVYLTGFSYATWGSPVRAHTGSSSNSDAFAAKLNSSGALTWNTFLGGSGDDFGNGIAWDGSGGNVYVTGQSSATWGSPVRAYTIYYNAFAAKLNSYTGGLTWNTFLSGIDASYGYGITVDGSGNVYVTGSSWATWGSPVQVYIGGEDAFAAMLSSAGTLTWNTFLGGSGDDRSNAIAVDGSGNVYMTGQSSASWGSPKRAFTGAEDAFVAKLNSAGTLAWNTFLGGSGSDYGYGIAVDGSGNVYMTGNTDATWGSPVRTYTGAEDAFAAKIYSSTGELAWNTFLGGSDNDYGNGIAVGGSYAYVTGSSSATWGSPVRTYTDSYDAFAAIVDIGLPGAFSKTTPAGAVNASNNPTLSWDASGNATSYEYCVDTSNNNTCDSSWISTGTSTSVGLSGLTDKTMYYWQVRANNQMGTTYANSGTWWVFKARTVSFTDVPASYWDWSYIETIYADGITSGCSQIPLMYCPANPVTREQMAVFILKSEHGSSYIPPAMTGVFTDVPIGYWAGTWIEQLYYEGITAGCSQTPLMFCPSNPVTREQMAVFLMKGEHGSSYTPPAMTGLFSDVPIGYWAGTWIEQLYHEGITSGCSQIPLNYCPANPVTRDQMAVFLVKTFHLLWP